MNVSSDFEQRLELLESKTAFQERTIEQLNQIITKQEMLLMKIQEQICIIVKRLTASQIYDLARQEEEKLPPHY
ncbi:Protein SlyX [Candidatus Hartigia pinicola]|nr:Protein SlyX [Candidatus Hartigia pinicola]